jgi:hypothetical protein
MVRLSVPAFVSLILVACGGAPPADPRCEALCQIELPSTEGAYDVCSGQSAEACKAACTARIESASSLCATCLLEKATFTIPASDGAAPAHCAPDTSGSCTDGTCSLSGHGGTCSFCSGNEQEELNCIKQAFPRREVQCTPTFRPVAECAAMCVDQEG